MASLQTVQNNKIGNIIYYEFHPELEQSHHYLRVQNEETLVISFATEDEFDELINAMYNKACLCYNFGMMKNINLTRPPIFNNPNARPFHMKYYWTLYDYVKSVRNIINGTSERSVISEI
jgi:hypothetical protein